MKVLAVLLNTTDGSSRGGCLAPTSLGWWQLTDVPLASSGGFAASAAAVSIVLRSALHSRVRATHMAPGQHGTPSGGGARAAPGAPPVSSP